jgi:capsular exopolysaccharide synthesis family protein
MDFSPNQASEAASNPAPSTASTSGFAPEAGAVPNDVAEWNISMRAIRHSISHRRKLVFTITSVGLALGILLAALPRHYLSTSRIQIRPGSANQFRVEKEDLLGMGDSSTKLESETLMLQSDTLLLDMAQSLHLENNPEFMGKALAGHSLEDPEARDALLRKLHKAITVTHLPRTEVIYISGESHSAVLSAQMVNELVNKYIDHIFQSRFASTKRVADWLSGQLDDLKSQVEADQEQLIQLQGKLGVVGLDQNHDIAVTELEDLTRASDEARVMRIIAEARYRILSSGDANLLEGGQDILSREVPTNSSLSLLSNLRNQKAQAESRYAALNAQFGAKYPDVLQAKAELQTLEQEIGLEQQRVLNQARESYTAALNNEKTTTGTLEKQKELALEKHSDMVRYQILLHDFESSRTLYEGLLQRLRQAGIVSGLESSEVDIFDIARISSRPTELNRVATIAIGFALGLTVSLVIAVLLGQFDNRLHSLSEIESEIHLPLLSITSSFRDVERKSVVQALKDNKTSVPKFFIDMPNNPFVESMWSLRTAIILSSPGRPPKTILLTSCSPGEGKTTLTCGLACAFALRGSRVLLIDGDLRRPSLAKRLHLSNKIGLSSVLTGSVALEEAIQTSIEIPSLFVLTSGPVSPSPVAILDSETMKRLMARVEAEYDVVLIDSPPVLGLADAPILAQFSDSIVLVLSYHQFNKAQVRRSKSVLARSQRSVTGIALNFSELQTLEYYGYGYRYGYASNEKDQEVNNA